eukprot:CAMPEP_0205903328 /NCGR_PEP_ID=MMETSP1325-20131115/30_1 /ASSEMBLY_ACC=CAM_ASM_000708 /TAXON_ID=236786 /ORGANISM="Florenciella sp., Strain RCC1007" /LENGTH=168 /DNA_ID=CAMNT_0053268963 /DNA_START=37 /DNA_END=543 /DNA_ORIENTATION=+
MNQLRRSVVSRAVAHRSIDWSSLSTKLSSDSAKAEVSRLRATYGEIQALANNYSGPPTPIDFAAYKAKISTPGLVDKFEAEYKTISFPKAVAEELAEIKEQHAAMLSEAEKSVEDSKARIVALTELVAAMESNQVGYQTTLEQLYELYPGLQEEIEAEIEAHEWGKDI